MCWGFGVQFFVEEEMRRPNAHNVRGLSTVLRNSSEPDAVLAGALQVRACACSCFRAQGLRAARFRT